MALPNIDKAERPVRRRQGMTPLKETTVTEDQVTPSEELAALWQRQYPKDARRFGWLQQQVLFPNRTAPVNPNQTEITDAEEITRQIKDYAYQLGADDVGIAEYVPEFTFADKDLLSHQYVIAFALKMDYDLMADIGPTSQHEVHRVYFKMLDIGVQLAQYIGSFGYRATAHPNGGELPHIPYGYLAGLGELGKHGSLISPRLGSSIRLSLVSTDMPLVADGPQDYGIEDMCAHCNICTKFCPGDAIGPEKSTVKGVTRWYVDTEKCFPYFESLWGCKICLMVCPFNGRTVTNKESYKGIAKEINKAKTKEGLLTYLANGTPEAKDNPVLVQFLDDPV
jgi:Pyruvate/2-oxoacid:ferredoxin oxidoreductase delta subunit